MKKRVLSGSELVVEYLTLPPVERCNFDRFYAERTRWLDMAERLARATPKQLQRVREVLNRITGKSGIEGDKRGLPPV